MSYHHLDDASALSTRGSLILPNINERRAMLDSPRWALTRRKLARGAFVIDQKELRQLATGADLDPKAFAKQMRSLNVKLNAKELGMLFCAFDNDGDGTVAAKEFAKHLSDVKSEEKVKRERLAREDNSYFLERKLEREAAVVAKHRKQAQVAVRAPQPVVPAGPVVLVDHLVFRDACHQKNTWANEAFAGYVADDVMGAGARPAFAAEITRTMMLNNTECCKHPWEGLVIPVYLSTIDSGNGSITDRNFEAAQIHLDDMGMCGYNKAITARVIKDGVAYPLVSRGGPSGCPCIPGADMTVGATTLKGAKHPCPQSCADTSIFHPVEGDPGGAGMHRWILQPGASGPGRDPVQPFRRTPYCWMGGGWTGVRTYSIQLPAKNDVPPGVWFASAIWADMMDR